MVKSLPAYPSTKLDIMCHHWAAVLIFVSATTATAAVEGFVAPQGRQRRSTQVAQRQLQQPTRLSALPPPFIISPLIRKFREGQEQKNAPMADRKEAEGEAQGLRVGEKVWKWPAIWPYDETSFRPISQQEEQSRMDQINSMASMVSGVAQVQTESDTGEDGSSSKEAQFDPVQYWSEEKGEVETNLDPEAAEKLTAHYAFYLEDGMSILELGAAENSYLPEGLKPSRHVGVGANLALMEKNPSLTKAMVVDLNNVVVDRDVDSDELRVLAKEPFDVVITANTVGYLTNPREVFRSAWYLLKPGGRMLAAFAGKDGITGEFDGAQTFMWNQYNDDQHMWITGSFFQFSAGDGWSKLQGFDISPEGAKDVNDAGPLSRFKPGKANNMFVVQAVKGYQDDRVDPENLERSIGSLCWMLPVIEDRDKKLVVQRLARIYATADSRDVRDAIERNIDLLPKIYESLINMDQFAFTFSMQSQLAADLVADPDFTANEDQILALKQGLGLLSPSEDFWLPVGQNTGAMIAEDKISLLSYLVPSFGSDNPAQQEALQAFVTGLKPTFSLIRSKCPDLPESDVQLLGSELLAAQVSKARRSSRSEFASWIVALSEQELRDLLSARKALKTQALADMGSYQEAREEERQRIEEYKKLLEEQVENAREERSMIFNPQTQKMELFDNPRKKKGPLAFLGGGN